MDITNRIVKICRKIEDIEYALSCKDQGLLKEEELSLELMALEEEYNTLYLTIKEL